MRVFLLCFDLVNAIACARRTQSMCVLFSSSTLPNISLRLGTLLLFCNKNAQRNRTAQWLVFFAALFHLSLSFSLSGHRIWMLGFYSIEINEIGWHKGDTCSLRCHILCDQKKTTNTQTWSQYDHSRIRTTSRDKKNEDDEIKCINLHKKFVIFRRKKRAMHEEVKKDNNRQEKMCTHITLCDKLWIVCGV